MSSIRFDTSARHCQVGSVLRLITVLIAFSCGYARDARAAGPFFLEQNGGFYFYPRESSSKFSSIQAKIESGYYSARGVHNFTIYCPYRAADPWRGVPAIDFFSTNPNTGTVSDFKAMVASAHAHDMRVVIYVGLLFVDVSNDIWVTAQADRKAGRQSPAANTFRWASNGSGPVPPFGSWAYSEAAQSYYAQSWEHPAIDLAQAQARAYIKSVLKFWMDQGVDGFEYDSPESFWGQTDAILSEVLVAYPNSYSTRQKYLIAEGKYAAFAAADYSDKIGFTHVLLSVDDDDRSEATDVINGHLTVDELDAHFSIYLDTRRSKGRGAQAVSNYSNMPAEERALEAAVLAGNGAFFSIDYDQVYTRLDAQTQRQYDAVIVALGRSAAEVPGATRKRVPAGPGNVYAVLRSSQSGARALNVYNFAKQAATISVDLTGTGISAGAVPIDLTTNRSAAPVTSSAYRVTLPPLGYALLGFGGQPVPATGRSGAAHAALLLGAIALLVLIRRRARQPPNAFVSSSKS